MQTQGGYDPQSRTQLRFLYNAPTPKFHHPTFTRSEVIMLTNTQTSKHTNTQTDAAENIQTLFATLRRWEIILATSVNFRIAAARFVCNAYLLYIITDSQ